MTIISYKTPEQATNEMVASVRNNLMRESINEAAWSSYNMGTQSQVEVFLGMPERKKAAKLLLCSWAFINNFVDLARAYKHLSVNDGVYKLKNGTELFCQKNQAKKQLEITIKELKLNKKYHKSAWARFNAAIDDDMKLLTRAA